MKLREFFDGENWCRFHLAKRHIAHTYRWKDSKGKEHKKDAQILVPCHSWSKHAKKWSIYGAMEKLGESGNLPMLRKIKLAILADLGMPVDRRLGAMLTGPRISEWEDQAEWEDVERVLAKADV